VTIADVAYSVLVFFLPTPPSREELGERNPKQNSSNGLWSPIPEGGVGRKKTKTE
jgi:hypothetical protein